MKNVKSLILMLLIPLAAVFMGCENEIPEEMAIEFDENLFGDRESILEQIDYFMLTLYKVTPDANTTYDPVRPNIRLNKGDILMLDGLEPGLYELSGWCYQYTDEGEPQELTYNVTGKTDNMYSYSYSEFIEIDEFTPVVVRLCISIM